MTNQSLLQPEYKTENNKKSLLISYLVVILYDIYPSIEDQKNQIFMISNYCIPNGLLKLFI